MEADELFNAAMDADDFGVDGMYESVKQYLPVAAKDSGDDTVAHLIDKYTESCKQKGKGPWTSELLLNLLDLTDFQPSEITKLYSSNYANTLIDGFDSVNLTVTQAKFFMNANHRNLYASYPKIVYMSLINNEMNDESDKGLSAAFFTASTLFCGGRIVYGDWHAGLDMVSSRNAMWFSDLVKGSIFTLYNQIPIRMDKRTEKRIEDAVNTTSISSDDWAQCVDYMLTGCVPQYRKTRMKYYVDFMPSIVRLHNAMMVLHPENYPGVDSNVLARFAFIMTEFVNMLISKRSELAISGFSELTDSGFLEVHKSELLHTLLALGEHKLPMEILTADLLMSKVFVDEAYNNTALADQIDGSDFIKGDWSPVNKRFSRSTLFSPDV